MFMNSQEHAAELFAQNNFRYMREVLIPSHPDLDEVTSRMADPAAMNGMLNWGQGQPDGEFLSGAR